MPGPPVLERGAAQVAEVTSQAREGQAKFEEALADSIGEGEALLRRDCCKQGARAAAPQVGYVGTEARAILRSLGLFPESSWAPGYESTPCVITPFITPPSNS